MRGDDGFSLVELVVVVGIIAVLVATSIPVYLGIRQRAQDRAAQTALRHALVAAKALVWNGDYTNATAAALASDEPALDFVDQPAESSSPAVVSVNPRSANEWVATVRSYSARCFVIRDRIDAGTYYATLDAGDCEADAPPAVGASAQSW
jgi:type IV pilus assembly protein PilA